VTWCPNCKADVKPRGKGQCPRCGRVLKLSFLSRKHPVNKLRRQQLLDKLVADYHPSTTVHLASCEHLAGVLEQLEVLKAGSQEHKRLVELSLTLAGSLEESRATRQVSPNAFENHTDAQLVARLEGLLKYARETDELRQRVAAAEQAQAAAEKVQAAATATPAAAPTPQPSTTKPAPEPEPKCRFCYQTPAACTALKTDNLDTWRTLHSLDPEEVARRDAEATAEMFHQVGRPLPPFL